MTVQSKDYYTDKKEMTRSKLKRCLLCGIDKEILMPNPLKVNQQTWQKLNEIRTKDDYLHFRNSSYHNPKIDGTVDDITLKPIDGMSFDISVEMCLDCIDKIGHKHKFKKKYLNTPFAHKYV